MSYFRGNSIDGLLPFELIANATNSSNSVDAASSDPAVQMQRARACLLASQRQTNAMAAGMANPQELWMLRQRYANNREHQQQLAALQNHQQMMDPTAGTTLASMFTALGANPTMVPVDLMPTGYHPIQAAAAMAGSTTHPIFMVPPQAMKALPAEFSNLAQAQQKHANSLSDAVQARNAVSFLFSTPQVPTAQSQMQQAQVIEWLKHQKKQVEAVEAARSRQIHQQFKLQDSLRQRQQIPWFSNLRPFGTTEASTNNTPSSPLLSPQISAFKASPELTSQGSINMASKKRIVSAENNGYDEVGPGGVHHLLVPCRARGTPADHNAKTAHFVVTHNMAHGADLICSYDSCRKSGVKFKFCAVCQMPVAKRSFRNRHKHGDVFGKLLLSADFEEEEDDTDDESEEEEEEEGQEEIHYSTSSKSKSSSFKVESAVVKSGVSTVNKSPEKNDNSLLPIRGRKESKVLRDNAESKSLLAKSSKPVHATKNSNVSSKSVSGAKRKPDSTNITSNKTNTKVSQDIPSSSGKRQQLILQTDNAIMKQCIGTYSRLQSSNNTWSQSSVASAACSVASSAVTVPTTNRKKKEKVAASEDEEFSKKAAAEAMLSFL